MNKRLITALIAIVFLAMPWNNKLYAQTDSISLKFPSRYQTFIFNKNGEMASDTLISKGSFHFFNRFSPRSGQAHQYHFRRAPLRQKSNVIDLNDQGIITYKKKKLSGGREKIIIIRKEAQEVNTQEQHYPQYIPYGEIREDDDLRKMNAPREMREPDIRRKDLPSSSEVPAPADKK